MKKKTSFIIVVNLEFTDICYFILLVFEILEKFYG